MDKQQIHSLFCNSDLEQEAWVLGSWADTTWRYRAAADSLCLAS